MTVTITIAFAAVDGERDELVEAMIRVIPDTLAFDGCQNIQFVESTEEPGALLLIENWESLDHYARYKSWRAESGTSVLGTGLVRDSPVTDTFVPLI